MTSLWNSSSNNNNTDICIAPALSNWTESEALAVARWTALVKYGRTGPDLAF